MVSAEAFTIAITHSFLSAPLLNLFSAAAQRDKTNLSKLFQFFSFIAFLIYFTNATTRGITTTKLIKI